MFDLKEHSRAVKLYFITSMIAARVVECLDYIRLVSVRNVSWQWLPGMLGMYGQPHHPAGGRNSFFRCHRPYRKNDQTLVESHDNYGWEATDVFLELFPIWPPWLVPYSVGLFSLVTV